MLIVDKFKNDIINDLIQSPKAVLNQTTDSQRDHGTCLKYSLPMLRTSGDGRVLKVGRKLDKEIFLGAMAYQRPTCQV